jgi:hypothetical protein
LKEKDMVLDVLNGTESSTSCYTKAISKCDNIHLQDKLKLMRDSDEKFHHELYKISKMKGYSISLKEALEIDITELKQQLIYASALQQGGGPIPNIN